MTAVKVTIKIDMNSEEMRLFEGRKKVGILNYVMDIGKDKIILTTLEIRKEFQGKGYGTLLVHALMGVADALHTPIYAISDVSTIAFYEKLGFICLRKFKNGEYKEKEVIIMNLRTCDFLDEVEKIDLIWIPSKLEKVKIYI